MLGKAPARCLSFVLSDIVGVTETVTPMKISSRLKSNVPFSS